MPPERPSPNRSTPLSTGIELPAPKEKKKVKITPAEAAMWTDNYISLLPGQSKTIECRVVERVIRGENERMEVEGWNTPLSESIPTVQPLF